jgi:DNA transformation protein
VANTPDYIAHVLDLFGQVGHVQVRPMFGGHGVYLDRLFVGIVLDDVLYLKSDHETASRFTARGLEPFRHMRAGRPTAMGFHRAPSEALEDLAAMREWVALAKGAALRAAAAAKSPGGDGPTITTIVRRTRGPGTRVTGRPRMPGRNPRPKG